MIGSVFGSQPNKLSKPVSGEAGVFAFSVLNFNNPAPLGNTYKQKESLAQGMTAQRAIGLAFQALQDKSKIKDNRVKFY